MASSHRVPSTNLNNSLAPSSYFASYVKLPPLFELVLEELSDMADVMELEACRSLHLNCIVV
eukprot:scaffold363_cov209-Alexandrium_tamarense.AAC.25